MIEQIDRLNPFGFWGYTIYKQIVIKRKKTESNNKVNILLPVIMFPEEEYKVDIKI